VKPSPQVIKFIHSFEGYHRKLPNGDCTAYPDPGSKDGKPWTIGYGTTIYRAAGLAKYGRQTVAKGDTLTEAQAKTEFDAAVHYFGSVAQQTNPNLTQNQYDALVSFFYNAGVNTPQTERVRKGDFAAFEARLPSYNKGGDGTVMPGLVRRRAAELEMWRGKKVSKVGWLALTRNNDKYILRAMDGDTAVAQHEFTTTAGLISLLRQYPDAGTTVVTKEDWVPAKTQVTPPADTKVATLIKTTTKLPGNLTQLLVRVGDETISCVSGQGYAQEFRKPSDPRSRPGSMQPIPQGRYTLGSEEWAGTPGDWTKSFGPGLGPWWVALTATFSDDRSAFGFHSDYGPEGSAGCVVFQTRSDAEKFLAAIRKHKPRYLDVNWGL
jgi:lysozyme